MNKVLLTRVMSWTRACKSLSWLALKSITTLIKKLRIVVFGNKFLNSNRPIGSRNEVHNTWRCFILLFSSKQVNKKQQQHFLPSNFYRNKVKVQRLLIRSWPFIKRHFYSALFFVPSSMIHNASTYIKPRKEVKGKKRPARLWCQVSLL